MNEINIRQASEKAWRIISDREHISLSELAKNLNINMEIAALSAGWLAGCRGQTLYPRNRNNHRIGGEKPPSHLFRIRS